ncbi:SGNH/GDSL hydrolase family protein [Xanthomonas sp. NCPPB 2654]|uniref:SGNH/GDSL hydrolase family protein n=1 Tax=unclassified Xanthomonas TaxID=2643310 RepID=UPI0021DFC42E|nr:MULTISPECIES: SGNH/GDSL hydrolase family protein [unclassified Xanthomonas]MDL5364555.1 SGNH/GDSL hydrolase family protein [Xanthomonas sp. NCPPB 2654]UYC22128.1 SGNH/GDSL hydrolase family protein [Xanthomonas sp. CFBP 8443]
MKPSSIATMLSLCLGAAHPALAQSATPAADALQGKVDALYTRAPDTLQAKDVAELQRRLLDWAQLDRYRADNAALAPPAAGERRVVFYGDSITDMWGRSEGARFFPGKPYVNRGISGQTTAQMLVRFRQDVIDLKPAAVVILAGTNDLAGNTGLSTQRMIEDNLRSMAELAQANHIKLVLASVLPVSDYPWRPGLQPAEKIGALNTWIKQYAQSHGAVYLDYHSKMRNRQGGLDKALATDGVHPTAAGYALMAPLAQQAVERALAQP